MSALTFIQQQRIAQMAGLGAEPLPTGADEHGDVLVLVSRGDGMPELKCIAGDGQVRSITHPHEDLPAAVAA